MLCRPAEMMWHWLPIIGLAYLLSGCRETPRPEVAFYYWQTTFSLSADEQTFLNESACRILYVKFLDIARSPGGQIEPYCFIEMEDTLGLAGKTIIPCVFITNEVFKGISGEEILELAQHVSQSVQHLWQSWPGVRPKPAEIQLDCDWTNTTRAAYFRFLEKLQHQIGNDISLSATIRLHQFRDPAGTGVPPVQRGTLMLYNTGHIDDPNEINSIFKPADASAYIKQNSRYPLPLDLALPVFSWVLIFREESLWKIIPDPSPDLLRDTVYFSEDGPGRYRVKQGTFRAGHYLRPGDRLRLENITPEDLTRAAEIAGRIRLQGRFKVAFFHLDDASIRHFTAGQIKEISSGFSKR